MSDSELWMQPVTYAAVGATQAHDLFAFPPEGLKPMRRRVRIGHGSARFEYAWSEALSWGIHRRSGFVVNVSDTPAEILGESYVPLAFDDEGTPLRAEAPEHSMFGPDGTPFLVPGDTAVLVSSSALMSGVRSPVRVVYVIDEPQRKGFAYGTLPGHPETGEESFIIEQSPDGSVWLTITSLSRPSSWFWRLGYPVLAAVQAHVTRRYFRALTGPMSTTAPAESAR